MLCVAAASPGRSRGESKHPYLSTLQRKGFFDFARPSQRESNALRKMTEFESPYAIGQRDSLHLLLQLRQQIQGLERRQPIQIHLAQTLQHRLRQGREDGQLCRRTRP